MNGYIDIKDLIGEVFLILFFLSIVAGAIIANKILKKRK